MRFLLLLFFSFDLYAQFDFLKNHKKPLSDLPVLTSKEIDPSKHKGRVCLYRLVNSVTNLLKENSGKNANELQKIQNRYQLKEHNTPHRPVFHFLQALGEERSKFLSDSSKNLELFIKDIDSFSKYKKSWIRKAFLYFKKNENNFDWSSNFWQIGTHQQLADLFSKTKTDTTQLTTLQKLVSEVNEHFSNHLDPFLRSIYYFFDQHAPKIIYVLTDSVKIADALAYFVPSTPKIWVSRKPSKGLKSLSIVTSLGGIEQEVEDFNLVLIPHPRNIADEVDWVSVHFHELTHAYFSLLKKQWMRANLVLLSRSKKQDDLFKKFVTLKKKKNKSFYSIKENFIDFLYETWSYSIELEIYKFFYNKNILSGKRLNDKIAKLEKEFYKHINLENPKNKFTAGLKNTSSCIAKAAFLVRKITFQMLETISEARKITPNDFPEEYFPSMH